MSLRRIYTSKQYYRKYFFHSSLINDDQISHHQLTKSSDGYDFNAVRSSITLELPFVWIGKDLGPSVLALLKNYKDTSKEILGQTFYVVSERISYVELVKILSEGT